MSNLKDVQAQEPVKIILRDGKEYTIRFTLNAMAELEDKYGSVDAAFKKLDEGSIKAARFILWAGLMEDAPELSEQLVGSLMDIQLMAQLMNTLGVALDKDMPTQSEQEQVQSPNA